MIPEDIRQTIDAALRRARAVSLRNNSEADKAQTLRIDAALQWLQQDAPQPLDFPDGPGWWAGKSRHRQFAVWWTGFEVDGDELRTRWGEDDYYMRHSLADFKRDYVGVKWYRLSMPWDVDAQPTAEA